MEERRVDVLTLVLVPSLLFFLVVVASFIFRVCFKMTEQIENKEVLKIV